MEGVEGVGTLLAGIEKPTTPAIRRMIARKSTMPDNVACVDVEYINFLHSSSGNRP
jgi:hypothetical protein